MVLVLGKIFDFVVVVVVVVEDVVGVVEYCVEFL